jgi:small nuclear ribonucleoprotein
MVIKPEDILKSSLDKAVLVVLKNGDEVRGILRSFDEYLNIVLERAEGIGDIESEVSVIKGSKILLISPAEPDQKS